jgi:ABC-type sugar transport system permease subunit
MEWIKKNKIFILAVALPALSVLFFTLLPIITAMIVSQPKYDLLYVTNYYPSSSSVAYKIEEKKIHFYLKKGSCRDFPKLYRFSPEKNSATEIPIIDPDCKHGVNPSVNHNTTELLSSISIPEIENLILDSSDISPDGYKFEIIKHDDKRRVSYLFFAPKRTPAYIVKSGNRIKVPNSYDGYVQFLGWIIG